jgi:hypothetical protein
MIKVLSTTDYNKFTYIKGNRPTAKRVAKMIKAIKRKNQLADYPILVTPHLGKLGIADGQSRFEAAKALRTPIFYIERDSISIVDVSAANSVQTPWSPRDYVHSFAEQGKKDYVKLRAFIHEFHLPVTTSASLLGGKQSGGGVESIRYGTFRVVNEQHAYKVAHVIVTLKKLIPFATDRPLAVAIMHLFHIKDFDPERMIKKIEGQSSRMVKCASMMQYVELIEDLYNYRVRPEQLVSLKIEVQKRLNRLRGKDHLKLEE